MDIYVNRDGQNIGPYTAAELREMMQTGGIAGDAPAWSEGMDGWSTVGEVIKESPSAFAGEIHPPEPPPIAAGDDMPLIAAPPSGRQKRSTKLRPPGAIPGEPPPYAPTSPPNIVPEPSPSSPLEPILGGGASPDLPPPQGMPAEPPAASTPPIGAGNDPALATLRTPDESGEKVVSSVPREMGPGTKGPRKKKKKVEWQLSWLKLVGVFCIVAVFYSFFLPWIKAGPTEPFHRPSLGELFLTSDDVRGQLKMDTPKFLSFLLLVSFGGLLLSGILASVLSVRLGVWPMHCVSISACGVVMFALSLIGFLYFFYDIRLENLAAESEEARKMFVPVRMDAGFYLAFAIFVSMFAVFTLPDSSPPAELPGKLVVPLLFFAGATYIFYHAEALRKDSGVSYSELPRRANQFLTELDKAWLDSSKKEKSAGEEEE